MSNTIAHKLAITPTTAAKLSPAKGASKLTLKALKTSKLAESAKKI